MSVEGVKEIQNTSKDKRLCEASIILSSPYTRAIQTAAILSKELQVDIIVETDLYEWIANKNYIYEDDTITEKSCREFVEFNGVYPTNSKMSWEDMSSMRNRILPKVIVACHGMFIQSLSTDINHKMVRL